MNTALLDIDLKVREEISSSSLYSDVAKSGMLDLVQYLTEEEKLEIIKLLSNYKNVEAENMNSLHTKIEKAFTENQDPNQSTMSKIDKNIAKNIYHKLIEMLR